FGPVPSPLPTGLVSATVVWSGVQQRVNIRNTDPVFGGFAGEFIRNKAQMEWTATVGDYTFVSDPLATSSSDFAEIGHERNGSFFPEGEPAQWEGSAPRRPPDSRRRGGAGEIGDAERGEGVDTDGGFTTIT